MAEEVNGFDFNVSCQGFCSKILPVMLCTTTQNITIVCDKSYRSFSEVRMKSFSKALTLIDISTVLKETNLNVTNQVFDNYLRLNLKISFIYKSLAKTKVVKAGLSLNYKCY